MATLKFTRVFMSLLKSIILSLFNSVWMEILFCVYCLSRLKLLNEMWYVVLTFEEITAQNLNHINYQFGLYKAFTRIYQFCSLHQYLTIYNNIKKNTTAWKWKPISTVVCDYFSLLYKVNGMNQFASYYLNY